MSFHVEPLGQFDLQALAQDNNLELSGLLQWYQRIHQQVNPLLGAVPNWKRPESFISFPPEIHHRITEWLELEGKVKIIIMSKVRVGNPTCGDWGRGSDSTPGTQQVLLWLLGLCPCWQCWNVSAFWDLGLKQLCLEGRGNALWIERDWENANVSTEFNSTGLHCWSYGGKNALFTVWSICNACFQACLQKPWNILSCIHSTAAWNLEVAAKWSCNLCVRGSVKLVSVQYHFFPDFAENK